MDGNNEYCNRWFWHDYSITIPDQDYLSHATITADLQVYYKQEINTNHEHKENINQESRP
jgi:hypothetical protein